MRKRLDAWAGYRWCQNRSLTYYAAMMGGTGQKDWGARRECSPGG